MNFYRNKEELVELITNNFYNTLKIAKELDVNEVKLRLLETL